MLQKIIRNKMNPDFALHIDCYKIINWLDQRKKLVKDWQTFLKAAQTKCSLLIQNKDPLREYPTITKYLQDHSQNFTFTDVNHICTQLLSTPLSSQRNILSQYTNPTLKEWLALRKFMQGKLVGVLLDAKYINQVLKFEIPGLKKTVETMQNQITNMKRKIDSNTTAIATQREEYRKECRHLGIQGEHIHLEIPRLVRQLPEIFKKVEGMVREAVPAVLNCYLEFCKVNGSEPQKFQLLKYMIENGDDIRLVYEGEIKENVEELRKKKYEQFAMQQSKDEDWDIKVGSAQPQATQNLDTLLYSLPTRQHLLYSLNELLFFLLARKEQSSNRSTSSSLLSSSYSKIDLSEDQLTPLTTTLTQIITLLTSPKTTELLNLTTNPKTYERIVKRLEIYGTNQKRLKEDIEKYNSGIRELEQIIERNLVMVEDYKEQLQRVRRTVEEGLTEVMKKQCRVVGEINKL